MVMRQVVIALSLTLAAACGNVHTSWQDCCTATPSTPPVFTNNPIPTPPIRPLYVELNVQGVQYTILHPTPSSATDCYDPSQADVIFDSREVNFDNRFTIDWDYGDGGKSLYRTSPTSSHTYHPAAGSWVATATVTALDGRIMSVSVTVVLPAVLPATIKTPFCP